MKHHFLPLLATTLLLLAGCSSSPKTVNTGPIHAATFSYVDRGATPVAGIANSRDAMHARIQEAITKNLEARSLKRVPSNGDVVVGYLVITGNNVSTTAISDYFAMGEDAAGLHDKAQSAYNKSKNPDYFEAGTLVIDIIDGKSFKLLKRGNATRQLLKNPTAEAQTARIQEVVDEILRDVRIAH
jgi:hypothetical protein